MAESKIDQGTVTFFRDTMVLIFSSMYATGPERTEENSDDFIIKLNMPERVFEYMRKTIANAQGPSRFLDELFAAFLGDMVELGLKSATKELIARKGAKGVSELFDLLQASHEKQSEEVNLS